MNSPLSRRQALAALGALTLPLAGCRSPQSGTIKDELHLQSGGTGEVDVNGKKMRITKEPFGKLPDGRQVHLYTFKNTNGVTVKVSEYGGIITEVHTPDRNGRFGNVVLGFDNLDRYLKGHPFFGAITGRVANRIAKGKFTLDGKEYTLAVNNGPNHLHGGLQGFDKRLWEGGLVNITDKELWVDFQYVSPDGEEGYPGKLSTRVRYILTHRNEIGIEYEAITDAPTILNLTNHSYFNLAGRGDVLGHELRLYSNHYTPVDEGLIPNGLIASVKGTVLDFTAPHKIGERHLQTGLKPPGYDHNFVVDGEAGTLRPAARVYEPVSGRTMEVLTTEPGVQLYIGIHLDGSVTGVGGVSYPKFGGFCLETQHYPDSVNKPNFPSIVLRPGQIFRSETVFRFGTA